MKKYDLIVGIGCSFMEGGGLDNIEIHRILNSLKEPQNIKICEEFKTKNNFIAYLSKFLNCDYINLSESQSANDLIFKKIFDYFKTENLSDKNILFVGQISMFSRQYVYYEKTKSFKKLNKIDFSAPPFHNEDEYKELFEYYKNYLSFIYNEEYALEMVERNIELLTNWLNNKNIDCIWLSYDGTPEQFIESKTFIKFDGDNLGAYIGKNKLRLCDIPELETGDLHMSIEGHKIVAEKIYKKLSEQ